MYETGIVIITIYGLMLSFIFCYSLLQINLLFNYRKQKRKADVNAKSSFQIERYLPFVTVQLPVYNEYYVIERLVDAVCKLKYPLHKLQIQVLDDSNDESFEKATLCIALHRSKGIDIEHIQRPDRSGFKAGALAFGLVRAKGEFIAIFDADFVPPADFLLKTVHHFSNPQLGVVQCRWGHLNKNYSLLTRLQAFGLDAHFSIEQVGRNHGKHFINFNGTAGIWRKNCIVDSGGWQSDTLTEDLDLSYRAQLAGWEFHYLEQLDCPAELPAEMNALKSQQFRWTKGAAECAIKNLPAVLKNRRINFSTKVHAVFHLMNSAVFLCVLGTALLSIPVMILKHKEANFELLFTLAGIFILSLIMLVIFYWNSFAHIADNTIGRIGKFIILFPLFLSVSMGMSLHNSIAVLQGYSGKRTDFVRTPKFNIFKSGDLRNNKYLNKKINVLTIMEGFLALYFLAGILLGIYLNDFTMIPFHLMLSFGFAFVFYNSTSLAKF